MRHPGSISTAVHQVFADTTRPATVHTFLVGMRIGSLLTTGIAGVCGYQICQGSRIARERRRLAIASPRNSSLTGSHFKDLPSL